MRRALALLVAASLLAPAPTRGGVAPLYTAPADPPAKAADLTWKGPTRTGEGVWLTTAQSIAVGERVLKCEGALLQSIDSEARCAVALAKAQGDVKTPRWVFVAVGIAVGVAGGFGAGYVTGRLAH
jgi:hypothetical protein